MMVDRVLASAHLSSRDVSIIGVGLGASAVAAISSGQIDAICTAEPTVSLLEQAGKVKVLADARTLAGTAQVFGGQVPTSALYAPSAYIRANPRITQALANAIIRADQWIAHASPADVARTVPESYHEGHTPLYVEAFTRVRDGYSTDGMFLPRGADNTLAALAAFDPKILPSAIRLSATYTNQFAEQFSKTGR
jgi:NitT/TauT family transport system substrate-binding protein